MYYYAEEIDQGLSCSFCRKQFVDVVKMLPECGDCICGECYEDLLDRISESREFACQACNETHEMPAKGLSDSKGLLRMLKKRKIERPLSEQAKTLKSCVESLRNQRDALESFDRKDYVHSYCDQLEFQVSETISSVVKDLNEIEADLLNEIKQYREKRLDALSVESTVTSKAFEQELAALYQEFDNFSAKWNEFFDRLDVLASEADIDSGLNQAKELEKRMQSMDERCRKEALKGKRMIIEERPFILSKSHMENAFHLIEELEIKISERPSLTFDKHSDQVYQVIFLPDGNLASSSYDGTIKIWDPVKGDVVVETDDQATDGYAMCLLSDGSLACTCKNGYSIQIRDSGQLKEIRSLKDHANYIISFGVLKSGHLASCSVDDTIKIWNPTLPDNNLLLTITGHGNTCWVAKLLTVLPNDNVAGCSQDINDQEECILRVWNSRDGQLIKSIPTGFKSVASVLALSDDLVAIGFENGTIKIVDLTDDTKSRVKKKAHLAHVWCLEALSNGRLISAGDDTIYCCSKEYDAEYRIKVWSLPDFNLLQSFQVDHTEHIESLIISPDEKLLASAGKDSKVKLWPLKAL